MKNSRKKYVRPSIKTRKLKVNFLFISDLNDFNVFLASCGSTCPETCGPSCFLAGTPVKTPQGDKPIESLKIGDEVYSYNFSGKSKVVGRIKEVINATENRFLELNGSIRVTPLHRFWTNGKEWTPAGRLKIGDRLINFEGKYVFVNDIKTVERKSPVFNLHLHGIHRNYFASGLLVHNEKCN